MSPSNGKQVDFRASLDNLFSKDVVDELQKIYEEKDDENENEASNDNTVTISPRNNYDHIRTSSILTPSEEKRLRASIAKNYIEHIPIEINDVKDKFIGGISSGLKSLNDRLRHVKLSAWNHKEDRAKGIIVPVRHHQSGEKHLRVSRRDTFYALQKDYNCDDISHVRKPVFKKLITSRRFIKYMNRYANCQYQRTIRHKSLPQPSSQVYDDGDSIPQDKEKEKTTEMTRTRSSHRFIICADTQFGIIMDGYALQNPNWEREMEISRKAVKKINAMKKPEERPLFVCVCGDLVDTEGSFSSAMASWKNIMTDWERHLIFEQQNKDFKDIWSNLDEDIALVCLCGNHDVGNRPTGESIQTFKSMYGDDYLAFWANGTYNIMLNNCLFSDPTGAMDLFKDQLIWLEDRLMYARKKAPDCQIFVFGHFPWFLYDENESDEDLTTHSMPPEGWGSKGMKFADQYFNIPLENRKIALSLFKKYNVKASFSGHFHQNVTSKTSWGMEMIITGPLSMLFESEARKMEGKLHYWVDPNQIGMRIVDVDETGFSHKFVCVECV